YGLELPGVTAAMQELERVESLAPPLVEPQTLVEHYADPAATRASLDTLAAAIKAHSLTVDAYQQARANAGRVVQTELFNAIDEIIEALRPEAEACITELNWYVSQGRP